MFVFFFMFERGDLAFVDDVLAAVDAHLAITADLAFAHATACDLTDFRDVEDLQDFGLADHLFDKFGRQHAFEGFFHILGQAVDDVIQADRNAFRIGQTASAHVSLDAEANDDGLGSRGQHHVILADVAGLRVQDFDRDIAFAQLVERVDDRLQRALHVGLEDQAQFLGLTGLVAGEEFLQGGLLGHAGLFLGRLTAL